MGVPLEAGMSEAKVVPLFPLNLVLFPGMDLPLHIFEPRYRMMVDRCLVERQPLAINLIRTGPEVGGEAEPFPTGTLAVIEDVARLPDSRMHIRVSGRERVRVVDLVEGEPYAQAHVEPVPEPISPVPAAELARVRELFGNYAEILVSLANIPCLTELPDDPAAISYAIAAILQTDLFTKQTLLEIPSARERLEHETRLLETEVTRLGSFRELLSGRGYCFYRGRRLSLN